MLMKMNTKHVAITGATAGIGRSTALTLAGQGAELTLFCRNEAKASELSREITASGGVCPQIIMMNMAELGSVRRAAEEFLALDKPLDVLLNNAGVVNTSRRQTVDGYEETLAVNHFAPFLLTGLLLPALQNAAAARIVNVASGAHAFVKSMGFDDMQAEQGYKTFREYGRSKLANILFTRSLAQRLQGHNITANSLHPGAVKSSLGTQNEGLVAKVIPRLLSPFFLSPEKGARTSVYLCSSDKVEGVTGNYYAKCKVVSPKPWARDDAAAQRLWSFTEDCVDCRYPL